MAIDTRDKRASAHRLYPRIRPIPDGVIDAADRRHIAGFYRGISAGEPPEGPIPSPDPDGGGSMAEMCLSTLEAGGSMAETCLSTLEGGAPIPTS